MLLALALEPLGIRRDARLCFRDQLLLPLRELCELVSDGALCPVEIVGPGSQPRLHLLLGGGQSLPELVGGSTRALGRGCPAFPAIRRSCSASREVLSARARASM